MSSSNSLTLKNILSNINQIENSIAQLYWSTYSINLSFNDIFTDQYDTEEGIDKLNSYYVYDVVNEYILRPQISNLILVTVPWTASRVNPTSAYCILKIDTNDVFQLGVDIVIQISTDNGSNYSLFPSLSIYKTLETTKYIRGDISGLIQYDSNIIKTEVICSSSRDIKIKGLATGVRYSL